MLVRFIPNTNKRYSITENGIIFSNYRYSNQGKKIFHKKEIARHLNNTNSKTLVVSLQFGKNSDKNKPKTVYLNTLMEKCFSLKPPDKFHFYDMTFKDGNCFNSSLSNLEYRIRVSDESNYKFYPQPFYNLRGKITHKICAVCGDKKDINNFNLQKPKKRARNKTYRNQCEKCRSKRQLAYINADINRIRRARMNAKKWANTKEGISYYKNYRKVYGKHSREELTLHYLSTILRINIKDLTPELISLCRKRVLLNRKIKQHKNEKAN